MSHIRLYLLATACLAVAVGCSDRSPITQPGTPGGSQDALQVPPALQQPERLARRFAKALHNPVFRAYIKAQLDASPFPEHKIHLQTFLAANGRRALRQIASQTGEGEAEIARDAAAAIPLEVYLPVPAHRSAWTGDEHVLVATALRDWDVPIAFDPDGGRHLLDAHRPPATPVLAVVPVETDFSLPAASMQCYEDCAPGGGADLGPAPGLYMTQAHFVQDFEGWLKGSPEFEVHILGQKGASDSLMSYQCAGEHAGGPYTFDQNALDWSGSVLLFSKQQLDAYNAAHPAQNVRVFVVEDDDTACQIKTDPDRFQKLIQAVDSAYGRLTTGNDSTLDIGTVFKYAKAAYNVWQALAHFLRSNDELVGNAVEDQIVGSFYPGYNWFVKGENNITNGWINLVTY
jgi:hypothetical protein